GMASLGRTHIGQDTGNHSGRRIPAAFRMRRYPAGPAAAPARAAGPAPRPGVRVGWRVDRTSGPGPAHALRDRAVAAGAAAWRGSRGTWTVHLARTAGAGTVRHPDQYR